MKENTVVDWRDKVPLPTVWNSTLEGHFVVGPLSDLVLISKAAYRGRPSEPSNKVFVSHGLG
jgi:hypothetical protein